MDSSGFLNASLVEAALDQSEPVFEHEDEVTVFFTFIIKQIIEQVLFERV